MTRQAESGTCGQSWALVLMCPCPASGAPDGIRGEAELCRCCCPLQPQPLLSPLAAHRGERWAQTKSWSKHTCTGTKGQTHAGQTCWREEQRPAAVLPSDPQGTHMRWPSRAPPPLIVSPLWPQNHDCQCRGRATNSHFPISLVGTVYKEYFCYKQKNAIFILKVQKKCCR